MAKTYSDEVMETVRQCMDLEPEDISRDSEIAKLSRLEVFEKCLNWEGIVGFSGQILAYIKGVYGVDLEPGIDLGEYLES